jgi:hypothetical protein
MTQVTNTGWAPPVLFAPSLDASAANIRETVFSGRFIKPYEIIALTITYEDNTNDSVRSRVWICPGNTTRTVPASSESSAGTVPTVGNNLFASQYGGAAVDYMTGDGPDELIIPVGQEIVGGFFLGWDNDNQDSPNVHVARLRVDMRELI